jgi:hypothetical protein
MGRQVRKINRIATKSKVRNFKSKKCFVKESKDFKEEGVVSRRASFNRL